MSLREPLATHALDFGSTQWQPRSHAGRQHSPSSSMPSDHHHSSPIPFTSARAPVRLVPADPLDRVLDANGVDAPRKMSTRVNSPPSSTATTTTTTTTTTTVQPLIAWNASSPSPAHALATMHRQSYHNAMRPPHMHVAPTVPQWCAIPAVIPPDALLAATSAAVALSAGTASASSIATSSSTPTTVPYPYPYPYAFHHIPTALQPQPQPQPQNASSTSSASAAPSAPHIPSVSSTPAAVLVPSLPAVTPIAVQAWDPQAQSFYISYTYPVAPIGPLAPLTPLTPLAPFHPPIIAASVAPTTVASLALASASAATPSTSPSPSGPPTPEVSQSALSSSSHVLSAVSTPLSTATGAVSDLDRDDTDAGADADTGADADSGADADIGADEADAEDDDDDADHDDDDDRASSRSTVRVDVAAPSPASSPVTTSRSSSSSPSTLSSGSRMQASPVVYVPVGATTAGLATSGAASELSVGSMSLPVTPAAHSTTTPTTRRFSLIHLVPAPSAAQAKAVSAPLEPLRSSCGRLGGAEEQRRQSLSSTYSDVSCSVSASSSSSISSMSLSSVSTCSSSSPSSNTTASCTALPSVTSSSASSTLSTPSSVIRRSGVEASLSSDGSASATGSVASFKVVSPTQFDRYVTNSTHPSGGSSAQVVATGAGASAGTTAAHPPTRQRTPVPLDPNQQHQLQQHSYQQLHPYFHQPVYHVVPTAFMYPNANAGALIGADVSSSSLHHHHHQATAVRGEFDLKRASVREGGSGGTAAARGSGSGPSGASAAPSAAAPTRSSAVPGANPSARSATSTGANVAASTAPAMSAAAAATMAAATTVVHSPTRLPRYFYECEIIDRLDAETASAMYTVCEDDHVIKELQRSWGMVVPTAGVGSHHPRHQHPQHLQHLQHLHRQAADNDESMRLLASAMADAVVRGGSGGSGGAHNGAHAQ